MRIAGIIMIVLGVLCLLDLVLTLILPGERADNVPFIGNTWAPILASFLIPGGVALLVIGRKRKLPRQQKP